MDVGELIELEVTDIAHGGVFVARHAGRVVFVADAVPGERVRAVVTEASRRSYARAVTVEVREASPHRRPHIWPAADLTVAPQDRPGGADLGHIALPHQRELKAKVLQDALRRFAHIDQVVQVEQAGADEDAEGRRWRTRVSLHVDDAGRIGPVAARSRRVIEVPDLPLVVEELEAAARALAPIPPGRIDLVRPADGRVREIQRPRSSRDRRPPAPPAAREVVVERIRGREFAVDAGGFWQVHRLAAAAIDRRVDAALTEVGVDPSGLHLDLYGGVGLLAATLGDRGGPDTRIVSVEADARATGHATANLSAWPHARAVTARVDAFVTDLAHAASGRDRAALARGVVVLDPPRSGAGERTAAAIAALDPAAIVYVACDPVALARDLAVLVAEGYRPHAVRALDLFPNSHHLEAVVALTRS